MINILKLNNEATDPQKDNLYENREGKKLMMNIFLM